MVINNKKAAISSFPVLLNYTQKLILSKKDNKNPATTSK